MSESEVLGRFDDLRPSFRYHEDSHFTEYGKELSDPISEALGFFENYGLHHGDVHSGNIMIGKDGLIYIVDFGKSTISVRKYTKYNHAIEEGRDFRRKSYMNPTLYTQDSGVVDTMSITHDESEKYESVTQETIENIEFGIQHTDVPRNIIDRSIAITYAKILGKDPKTDNYYFPDIIGYDLGGGYFLLSGENRPND